MRKSSPVPIILIALVALVVFGYANNAAFHTGAHPDAEEANEAIKNAMAAKTNPPKPPLGRRGPAAPTNAPPAVTELTVGDPATAKTRLTLGYEASDQIEENAQPLDDLVSGLQDYVQAHPGTSLQVVCVDIPVGDRLDKSTASVPVGVAKNGKVLVSFARGVPDERAVGGIIQALAVHP